MNKSFTKSKMIVPNASVTWRSKWQNMIKDINKN